MISIILPFFYYDEHRYNLFRKTFEHLPLNDERFEICVHEMGKEPFLDEFFTKNNKYLFSKFEGIFDRAWSLNVPAKHLATRNMLCLMDTDLLVSEDWKEEIVKCKTWSAGFGELRYLSSRATDIFLKTDKVVEEYQYFVDGGQKARSIIVPKGAKGAGGITLFPRKLFIELKGIPEEFKGTWGGEDTAFFHKVKTLK
jgi:predicted glycosyltransferase involved in capsule biosynthesis